MQQEEEEEESFLCDYNSDSYEQTLFWGFIMVFQEQIHFPMRHW